MKIFHICTKKEFEVEGEKKVKWYRAGFLKQTDAGKQYIHLFHQPGTDFYVFEDIPAQENPPVDV